MTKTILREFYTTKDVAKRLHMTHQHIARLCRQGKWNVEKFGSEYAIPRTEIDVKPWLEQNPDDLACHHRNILKLYIAKNKLKLNILGILATGEEASRIYADYLVFACKEVGINLSLKVIDSGAVLNNIISANKDPETHGVFIFYPIFKNEEDEKIKGFLNHEKDIEGLSTFWMSRLYKNIRFIDDKRTKKAILPCTPLAILKTLDFIGMAPDSESTAPFRGKKVTIFNRSDLVGQPLAHMLKNDEAEVFAFDIYGGVRMKANLKPTRITRAEALRVSDIVVTGVPSRDFQKVRASEIKEGAYCLNFSSVQNFEDDAKVKAGVFVPRVGPMTIAMCLRNTMRLYENYRDKYQPSRARSVAAAVVGV